MRKSILLTGILTLFSVTMMFGQATHNSDPIALGGTCSDTALTPIAGKSYDYSVIVNPTGGNFQWWATKDPNFITTTGSTTTNNRSTALTTTTGLMAAGSNYNQAPSTTGNTVSITWGTDVLANTDASSPTFVVVQYDAPSCSNNLKVYKIEPINAFTVDIKNMSDETTPLAYTGSGAVHSSCVSAIAGATYSTTIERMVYNYGTNELYFEVVAANFSGSYTPTFQLTGLQTGQTADIDWGYATGTYNNSVATNIAGGSTFTATSSAVTTNETNTAQGVSIYVRVTVNNGTYETTTAQTIGLAVTGVNTANQSDVQNDNCGVASNFTHNTATQGITPRPTVTQGSGAFIPSHP